jgi:hypothetical protein
VDVVGEGDGGPFGRVQAAPRFEQWIEIDRALAGARERAVAGVGDADETGFVEGTDDGLARGVRFEAPSSTEAVHVRNRGASGTAHADGVDLDSGGSGGFCGSDCVVFVVFAVRQDQDGLRCRGFGVEAGDTEVDGRPDGRALGGDELRNRVVEEELQGGVVRGDGALDVRIAREDHQAYAVTFELIQKPFDRHAGERQTVHAYILGPHAVRDVQGDDDVDALGGDFLHAGAQFGVEECDGRACQGGAPQHKPPRLAARTQARQEPRDQMRITYPLQRTRFPMKTP